MSIKSYLTAKLCKAACYFSDSIVDEPLMIWGMESGNSYTYRRKDKVLLKVTFYYSYSSHRLVKVYLGPLNYSFFEPLQKSN